MTRKADRDQIRRHNRGVILQALRRHGALARIDLGRQTGLSPATVTAITSDLLDEGLIAGGSVDDRPAARGRPRSLLTLDPAAAKVLGVKLVLGQVELILADFSGRCVAHERLAVDTLRATRSGLGDLLVAAIEGFLARHGGGERLHEIAIAAQGLVDTRRGEIVWSPALSVRDVPLAAPLRAAFRVPCVLSNDANMVAEALHGSDPVRFGGNFAVIYIGYGVGMGLYVGDRLYTGESGAAAEFGHANHVPGGRLCRCGKRGCVEAYLGAYAVVRAARGLPDDADPSEIALADDDMPALIAAARSGDATAQAAFAEAGRALGYGIARLVAHLDPRRVVLTGAGMRAYALMRGAMQSALEEALVEDLRRGVVIEPQSSQADLIAAGIVSGSLRRLDRDIFAPGRQAAARSALEASL